MNTQTENTTPSEVTLGRLTADIAGMLEREMVLVVDHLLETAGRPCASPRFFAAQQAQRVVLLCRSLVEEIDMYTSSSWWEPDSDPSDQNVPF